MPPTHTDEGLRATAVIRAELPDTGVVVLSQYVSERYAIQLLEHSTAGIGYLLKDRVMEPGGFADAVRQVARGGSALDPEVVAEMLDRRRAAARSTEAEPARARRPRRDGRGPLQRHDRPGLGISEPALQRHIARLLSKLDIPADAVGHRRVLAVLTYLGAQDD